MNKVQKTGILLLVLVLALTACTSFADTGERGNTMNNIDVRQQTEFRYNRFADLYYYLLAHMPIDYAADVSDPEYTAEMAGKLGIFPGIPPKLTEYYEENFDRLAITGFIPLAVKNTQQFREALVSCGQLTDRDMEAFVDPMIEICDRVSERFPKGFMIGGQRIMKRWRRRRTRYTTVSGRSRTGLALFSATWS